MVHIAAVPVALQMDSTAIAVAILLLADASLLTDLLLCTANICNEDVSRRALPAKHST